MSTPTEDRQFLLMCLVGAWTSLRIVAVVLGLVPWSGWIVTAMLAIGLAFVVWINNLEEVV